MGTIYTGVYRNHNIRIDNSFLKCTLYIDGKERDIIKGAVLRNNSNVLRATFVENTEKFLVEVAIDVIPIKKGSFFNISGQRFIIKINGEFFDTGFISNSHQKKYGQFLQSASHLNKNK